MTVKGSGWEVKAREAARVRLRAIRAKQQEVELHKLDRPSKLGVYLRRLPPRRQEAFAADLRALFVQYFFELRSGAFRAVDGIDITKMLDDVLGVRTELVLHPKYRGTRTRGRWLEPGVREAVDAVKALRREQKNRGPQVACRMVAELMREEWESHNATSDELIDCSDNTLVRKLRDAVRRDSRKRSVKSDGAKAS